MRNHGYKELTVKLYTDFCRGLTPHLPIVQGSTVMTVLKRGNYDPVQCLKKLIPNTSWNSRTLGLSEPDWSYSFWKRDHSVVENLPIWEALSGLSCSLTWSLLIVHHVLACVHWKNHKLQAFILQVAFFFLLLFFFSHTTYSWNTYFDQFTSKLYTWGEEIELSIATRKTSLHRNWQ